MTHRVAVVVTDSAQCWMHAAAIKLGFSVISPREAAPERIAMQRPALIMVDWSPSRIEENTALVVALRNGAATRRVPIFVGYSDKNDVPLEVWSANDIAVMEIPFLPVAFHASIASLTGDVGILKTILKDSSNVGEPQALEPMDQRLINALADVEPTAALSYQQAVADLRAGDRLSWRGTAHELREALRVALATLAPDELVKAEPWFEPEPSVKGPTMRQRARYVFRKRGESRDATEAAEHAVGAAEDAVGLFVRSGYSRSSRSAHTGSEKLEVLRARDFVCLALAELLAVDSA